MKKTTVFTLLLCSMFLSAIAANAEDDKMGGMPQPAPAAAPPAMTQDTQTPTAMDPNLHVQAPAAGATQDCKCVCPSQSDQAVPGATQDCKCVCSGPTGTMPARMSGSAKKGRPAKHQKPTSDSQMANPAGDPAMNKDDQMGGDEMQKGMQMPMGNMPMGNMPMMNHPGMMKDQKKAGNKKTAKPGSMPPDGMNDQPAPTPPAATQPAQDPPMAPMDKEQHM